MQFGIFSVSDITRNPVTGQTPSEAERIQASVQLAKKADEVGLDVGARVGRRRLGGGRWGHVTVGILPRVAPRC